MQERTLIHLCRDKWRSSEFFSGALSAIELLSRTIFFNYARRLISFTQLFHVFNRKLLMQALRAST